MLQQHLVQQLLQGTLQGQGSSSSITGAVTNNNSPCTIANTTTMTNNLISSQFVPVQMSFSVQGIQFVIKVINPISKRATLSV